VTVLTCYFLQFLGVAWRRPGDAVVILLSGAVFFCGQSLPGGSIPAGSQLAVLLALGPAAGIVAQVGAQVVVIGVFCMS